ncbi:MAG TPA: anti-sigma factor [Methylomirabilota bacterium]|nr:anti-sigma factor [Methylomirabilota bacterium]
MNRDEIRELAALYALGGLDGEDRARFEALLASGDADAQAAVRDFEGTLATLASATSVVPRPAVKSALMARLDAEGRPAPRPPAAELSTADRWTSALWPAAWAGALAAGLAALVVGLSVSATYEKRLSELAKESATLRGELERQQAVIALVRDPATKVVSLGGLKPAPQAQARMLWHPRAGGLLLVTGGLPPAPEGKAYELWAIVGKNPPVPAGVFSVDAKGTGSLRVSPLPGVEQVDVFAVTLEPADGVPAPTGAMYLAGKS